MIARDGYNRNINVLTSRVSHASKEDCSVMAVPLLERQLAPIPNPPPITEERLQKKGMVVCVYEPDSYNLVHTFQLRNDSSYKRKDTAIRGNLIMLRR